MVFQEIKKIRVKGPVRSLQSDPIHFGLINTASPILLQCMIVQVIIHYLPNNLYLEMEPIFLRELPNNNIFTEITIPRFTQAKYHTLVCGSNRSTDQKNVVTLMFTSKTVF